MSWSNLESTFSQVKGSKSTPRHKRKLFNKSYARSNFPVIKAKRPRLCAPLSENNPNTADSDESLDYDPDYDDYCNGCLNRSTTEILPIVTKSPDSKIGEPAIRSPLRQRNIIHDHPSHSSRYLTAKDRRQRLRNFNWKPLESTFREVNEEKNILEQSITNADSDENEENCPSQDRIQSQSSDAKSSQEAVHCPKEVEILQKKQTCTENSRSSSSKYLYDGTLMQFSKKIQCRKGGYVEKLRRVLNRQKSDYAFWYHAQRSGLNTEGVRTRVKDIRNMYGRKMIVLADGEGEDILVSIDDNEKLQVGSKIIIKLDPHCYKVNNLRYYLGFNKIKKL